MSGRTLIVRKHGLQDATKQVMVFSLSCFLIYSMFLMISILMDMAFPEHMISAYVVLGMPFAIFFIMLFVAATLVHMFMLVKRS